MGEFRELCFVVGAGASSELGLPVGSKLVEKIAEICNFGFSEFDKMTGGSQLLRASFKICKLPDGQQYNPTHLAEQATEIRHNMGLAPSIDNYMDSKKENHGLVLVGKLAIARSYLRGRKK